jgi:GMP synthase (glutamine-hydrolysing)
LPILGICYGAQLVAHLLGGKVVSSKIREYGRSNLSFISKESILFKNVKIDSQVWMSHGDTILKIPSNAKMVASTKDVKFAGYEIKDKKIFGVQFHPEVHHSTDGLQIISNFIFEICKCKGDWTAKAFVKNMVEEIREKVGKEKVILGLSGGVDSTVAAILLKKAIGKNLHCIFVDNGLLRKDEFLDVLKSYRSMGLNIKGVDAGKIFLEVLKEVSDPEQKRKIVGKTFVKVFDKESRKIKNAKWLGQGTIYPDIIESSKAGKNSENIKSHHNVGGLPDYMKLKLVEPLKTLFKDEVRKIGKELRIDKSILNRHPFPGPGLAIRILGELTNEKISILQEADKIFIDLLKENKLYEKVWQAGTVLLPVTSLLNEERERTVLVGMGL